MKTKLVWRQAGAGVVADEVPDYEGEIRRLQRANAKLNRVAGNLAVELAFMRSELVDKGYDPESDGIRDADAALIAFDKVATPKQQAAARAR